MVKKLNKKTGKKKIIKKRWVCDVCGTEYRLKKELIQHLRDEFEDADMNMSFAQEQLENLGGNPYK